MIVVGVLTALAADSWAERLGERATGSAYLQQLRIDTEVNRSLLIAAVEWQTQGLEAVEAVRSSRRAGTTIPADSMQVLIGRRHLLQPAQVQLVLGTVSALVGSPDLNLISDPGTRLALLNYASKMDQLDVEMERSRGPLEEKGSDIVVAWQAGTGFEEGGGRELGAWLSAQGDPRTNEALAHLWLHGAYLLGTLQNMSAATDSLATSLETLGKRRDGPSND